MEHLTDFRDMPGDYLDECLAMATELENRFSEDEIRVIKDKQHKLLRYLRSEIWNNPDDQDIRRSYWLSQLLIQGARLAIAFIELDRELMPKPSKQARLNARELKDRLDIVQIASRYTKLEKVSDEYMGVCPLHPSTSGKNFEVNPSKRLWHCFSCGQGGDVFKLVMLVEKLDFCQALTRVRELA